MNKAIIVLVAAVLFGSSLVGAVALSTQSPSFGGSRALIAPLRFQLNSKDPYVIELPLSQGEKVACDLNSSLAGVTLLLTFKGLVLWSHSFSGRELHQIQAGSAGTYTLTFESSSPAEVWVRLFLA